MSFCRRLVSLFFFSSFKSYKRFGPHTAYPSRVALHKISEEKLPVALQAIGSRQLRDAVYSGALLMSEVRYGLFKLSTVKESTAGFLGAACLRIPEVTGEILSFWSTLMRYSALAQLTIIG